MDGKREGIEGKKIFFWVFYIILYWILLLIENYGYKFLDVLKNKIDKKNIVVI